MLAGFTHRPVVELSERLAALAPAGLGHAFFASDGASATEIALKMSFHYWRNAGHADKRGFVSLAGGYHGETLGRAGRHRRARCSATSTRRCCTRTLPCRAPILARHRPCDAAAPRSTRISPAITATTAALIVEPLVQGASGMVDVRPRVSCCIAREITDAPRRAPHRRRDHDRLRPHGNDVRVGAGAGRRAGLSCACPRASPAATCRCRACSRRTRSTRRSTPTRLTRGFLHSHSYTGNALACRGGAGRARHLPRRRRDRAQPRERAARWAAHLRAGARRIRAVRHFRQSRHDHCFDVDIRAPGLRARGASREALERGLLLRPIGNTLYVMPPYIADGQARWPCWWNARCDILDRA